jgi:hypothetical protein
MASGSGTVSFCGHSEDGANADCSLATPGTLFLAIAPFTLLPFLILCGISLYCCLRENDIVDGCTSCVARCGGCLGGLRRRQNTERRQPVDLFDQAGEQLAQEEEHYGQEEATNNPAHSRFSIDNYGNRPRLSVVPQVIGRGANTRTLSNDSFKSSGSVASSSGRNLGTPTRSPSDSAAAALSFYSAHAGLKRQSSGGSSGARASTYRTGSGNAGNNNAAVVVRTGSDGGRSFEGEQLEDGSLGINSGSAVLRRRGSSNPANNGGDNNDKDNDDDQGSTSSSSSSSSTAQGHHTSITPTRQTLSPKRSTVALATASAASGAGGSNRNASTTSSSLPSSQPTVALRTSFYSTSTTANASSGEGGVSPPSVPGRTNNAGGGGGGRHNRSRSPLGSSLGVAAAAAAFAQGGSAAAGPRGRQTAIPDVPPVPEHLVSHFTASLQTLSHEPSQHWSGGSSDTSNNRRQQAAVNARGPAPIVASPSSPVVRR